MVIQSQNFNAFSNGAQCTLTVGLKFRAFFSLGFVFRPIFTMGLDLWHEGVFIHPNVYPNRPYLASALHPLRLNFHFLNTAKRHET